MNKKFFAVCVLCISLGVSLFVGESCAKRIEVKKAFFTGLRDGSVYILDLAREEGGSLDLYFQNEIMEVTAFPVIAWQGFTSSDIRESIRKAFSELNNFVFYASGGAFGDGEAYLGGIWGIDLEIRNKTPNLLFIDLNKSAITVGSYYGVPLASGNRHHENPNATLPPLLIPPKGTITTKLERADFYNSPTFGWTSVFEFPTDKNMLGYVILAVGDKEINYVTFELNCTVPLTALQKYRRSPGDF